MFSTVANGSAAAAPRWSEFEKAYAEITGAKHCLATSCGTSALTSTLGALDIGPGDEVIIPPYTFVATYNVVVAQLRAAHLCGHRPGKFSDRCKQDRSRDHQGNQSHSAGAYRRFAGGSRHDSGGGRQAQTAGDRRRLPSAPGGMARAEGGHPGTGGLLQFSGKQEPHFRRGRRGVDRRCRVRRELLQLPQSRPIQEDLRV